MNIPPNIFTYWHQGFAQAPVIVKHCLHQIRKTQTDAEVHALDQSCLKQVRPDIPVSDETWEHLALQHKSDLVRTALLIRHGGIWMDPTVFPKVNIPNWLADKMGAGLFFFQHPGRDRIVSNWFIAAQPQNPILIALMNRLGEYHANRDWVAQSRPPTSGFKLLSRLINRHPTLTRIWFWKATRYLIPQSPYMIYHYLLNDLLCRNSGFRRLWRKMPVVSAVPPHALQRIGLQEPMRAEAEKVIKYQEIPLFKLAWNLPDPIIPEGSIVEYLFGLSDQQKAPIFNA